jgi:hypothetical protein
MNFFAPETAGPEFFRGFGLAMTTSLVAGFCKKIHFFVAPNAKYPLFTGH